MMYHSAAVAFPLMTDKEFADLKADIQQRGQLEPISLYEGRILDGRNRYRACLELDIEPKFRTVDVDDPFMWVWSLNGERRRLGSQEQKALIWRKLHGMSADMQQRRARIKADADRERSEVQKGIPKVERGSTDCTTTLMKPKVNRTRELEAKAAGVNKGAMARATVLEKASPALADKVARGELKYTEAQRELKRTEIVTKLEDIAVKEAKAVEGVYDVLVIDPPWPMQKIERDVRPNQAAFDYPTMTEVELSDMSLPMADDCHIWLWATHRFLPTAFRLLSAWNLKYVCTFVWHKPGGFQPVGLPQFNAEFALYARHGTPKFIDTKAFPVCFNAPRGSHSEKPEEFYSVVRRVTVGSRLDMFSRRSISGFDSWGKEAS